MQVPKPTIACHISDALSQLEYKVVSAQMATLQVISPGRTLKYLVGKLQNQECSLEECQH